MPSAASDSEDRVIVEVGPIVDDPSWRIVGASAKDARVSLVFAVKYNNTQTLLSTLDAIADPTSPQYGKVRRSLGMRGMGIQD